MKSTWLLSLLTFNSYIGRVLSSSACIMMFNSPDDEAPRLNDDSIPTGVANSSVNRLDLSLISTCSRSDDAGMQFSKSESFEG